LADWVSSDPANAMQRSAASCVNRTDRQPRTLARCSGSRIGGLLHTPRGLSQRVIGADPVTQGM
jgi:hypothetical protein